MEAGESVYAGTDGVGVVQIIFSEDVGEKVCLDADDVVVDVAISEHDFDGS